MSSGEEATGVADPGKDKMPVGIMANGYSQQWSAVKHSAVTRADFKQALDCADQKAQVQAS